MTGRAFRIGGWIALVGGFIAAVAAAVTAVTGVLALTGQVTYPVDRGIGPFSFHSTVSMPVTLADDVAVCQTASVVEQDKRDCFRFFVHEGDSEWGTKGVYHQGPDVRLLSARLRGEVEVATTGGWSPFVAGVVASAVIRLVVLSGVLLLLWRLLTVAAAGEPFGNRTVRYLRGIGCLVIAGAVMEPALIHFTSAGQLGYSAVAFGPGLHLMPAGGEGYPGGVDLWQIALGGLALLLAEVFRHGAAIEAERRLTV